MAQLDGTTSRSTIYYTALGNDIAVRDLQPNTYPGDIVEPNDITCSLSVNGSDIVKIDNISK